MWGLLLVGLQIVCTALVMATVTTVIGLVLLEGLPISSIWNHGIYLLNSWTPWVLAIGVGLLAGCGLMGIVYGFILLIIGHELSVHESTWDDVDRNDPTL